MLKMLILLFFILESSHFLYFYFNCERLKSRLTIDFSSKIAASPDNKQDKLNFRTLAFSELPRISSNDFQEAGRSFWWALNSRRGLRYLVCCVTCRPQKPFYHTAQISYCSDNTDTNRDCLIKKSDQMDTLLKSHLNSLSNKILFLCLSRKIFSL